MKLKLNTLLTACLLSSLALDAQPTESATFHINNVKVVVQNDGSLFTDGVSGQFIAPYVPGQPERSTMRTAGLWAIGTGVDGNLFGATHRYGENGKADFQPGLLDHETSAPTNLLTGIYRVTKADILEHIADFEDNGVIDNPNPRVFGWPGRRNSYFPLYNGGHYYRIMTTF